MPSTYAYPVSWTRIAQQMAHVTGYNTGGEQLEEDLIFGKADADWIDTTCKIERGLTR